MKKQIVFNRGPGSSLLLAFALAIGVQHINFAQSLKRQVIASVGTSVMSNSILIQQTIGQPYHTATFYSNDVSFRPGFHQPFSLSSELAKPSIDQSVTVYPNPATSSFSINAPDLPLSYMRVTDINGLMVFEKKISDPPTNLNCQNWLNGLYVITVFDQNGKQYSSKLIVNK